MKKRNEIVAGLIAACAVCVMSAVSCAQCLRASCQPTTETAIATVGVRYVRTAVDLYSTHVGFAVDVPAGAMTTGRAKSLVGAVVSLVSLVIGALALARAAGRLGTGNGRAGAMVSIVLGLIGLVLSVVHLSTVIGGLGTGSGRAGAIVALVLALIGISLGGLALVRSRRSASAD